MDADLIALIDAATDLIIHEDEHSTLCHCDKCERIGALKRAVRAIDPQAI